MAVSKSRKPGVGSSQADIRAYIRQEVSKSMQQMKDRKSAASEGPKRSTSTASASKAAKGGAKSTKPKPKLS